MRAVQPAGLKMATVTRHVMFRSASGMRGTVMVSVVKSYLVLHNFQRSKNKYSDERIIIPVCQNL